MHHLTYGQLSLYTGFKIFIKYIVLEYFIY